MSAVANQTLNRLLESGRKAISTSYHHIDDILKIIALTYVQVFGQAFRSQPAARQREPCGKHLQEKHTQVSANDKTANKPA